jgi:hypothetical protein
MKSLTAEDLERSLFVRSSNNMFDMLEKLFLHENALSQKEADHYKDGAGNFLCAMITISQNNKYKGGNGMPIPYIIYSLSEA